MEELKPLQIEHRGYTIAQDENGHVWLSKGDNGAHIHCDDILNKEELAAKVDEFIRIEKIFDEIFEEAEQE